MEQEDSAEKAAREIRNKTRRRVARLWSAPGGEYPPPLLREAINLGSEFPGPSRFMAYADWCVGTAVGDLIKRAQSSPTLRDT